MIYRDIYVGDSEKREQVKNRLTELMTSGTGLVVMAGATRTGKTHLINELKQHIIEVDGENVATAAYFSPEENELENLYLTGKRRFILGEYDQEEPAPTRLQKFLSSHRDVLVVVNYSLRTPIWLSDEVTIKAVQSIPGLESAFDIQILRVNSRLAVETIISLLEENDFETCKSLLDQWAFNVNLFELKEKKEEGNDAVRRWVENLFDFSKNQGIEGTSTLLSKERL